MSSWPAIPASLAESNEWFHLRTVWKDAERFVLGQQGDHPASVSEKWRLVHALVLAGRQIEAAAARGLVSATDASMFRSGLEDLLRRIEAKVADQDAEKGVRVTRLPDRDSWDGEMRITCYMPADPVLPRRATEGTRRLEQQVSLLEKLAEDPRQREVVRQALGPVRADLADLCALDSPMAPSFDEAYELAERTESLLRRIGKDPARSDAPTGRKRPLLRRLMAWLRGKPKG